MTMHRGLSGVNRQIKSIHRGISGVSRTIKEQYRGLSGVNRKVFMSLPAGALYWLGDECTVKTGGWVQRPHNSGTQYGSTVYTKNADNLYYKNTSNTAIGYDAGWVTANNIDLTGYTTINIECAVNKTDIYDRPIMYIGKNDGYGAFNSGTWGRQVFSYTLLHFTAAKLESALACVSGKTSEVTIYKIWLS